MKKDLTPFLLGGSKPSLFEGVSQQLLRNYLVLEDILVPAHGKGEQTLTAGQLRYSFTSGTTSNVFVVTGDKLATFDSAGVYTDFFELSSGDARVKMVQNDNDEIAIADGVNGYVHNVKSGVTVVLNNTDNDFSITNPVDVVMVDTVFLFAGGKTVIQSKPNEGDKYVTDEKFSFQSSEEDIQALAEINKSIFFIGRFAIERWVVNSTGTPFLVRDNQFLPKYGLHDKKSFVNRFDIFIGLFSSRNGGVRVMMMGAESRGLTTLSTPGLINKMLSRGEVTSASLYEVDGVLYYEVTFTRDDPVIRDKINKYSFIYNFSSRTWSESTSPFEEVVVIGDNYFGGFGNAIYRFKKYENDQTKELKSKPFTPGLANSTVAEIVLYSRFNDNEEVRNPFKMGGSKDGVFSMEYKDATPIDTKYQLLAYRPQVNCLSFALYFFTKSNAKVTRLIGEFTK